MDDELKNTLGEACKGKSTSEIADAIMASKHGQTVDDPLAVAALLKSWNPGNH